MITTPEMLSESLDRDITLSSFAKAHDNVVEYAAIKYNPKHQMYKFVVNDDVIVQCGHPEVVCEYFNDHYEYIMKAYK